MIGLLKGYAIHVAGNSVLLDVQGVGYELELPSSCVSQLQTPTNLSTVYTHLLVREDAQLLFGFSSRAKRDAFRVLIKASGVGPKCALALLSHFSINDLVHCIESQAVNHLVAVKGIGAKLAQKMVLELKGSLLPFREDVIHQADATHFSEQNCMHEVKAALEALGFRAHQAEQAARQVYKAAEAPLQREDWIKQALQLIRS